MNRVDKPPVRPKYTDLAFVGIPSEKRLARLARDDIEIVPEMEKQELIVSQDDQKS